MTKQIPATLIAVVSDLVSAEETHASLDSLFMYAEASGDPPEGSKHVKAQAWLRNSNKSHKSLYLYLPKSLPLTLKTQ